MSNQNIFYSTQNEDQIFETCYRARLPLLLKGPTGCGKSQLVEHMSLKLNQELIKVSCNEDTNAADLFGRFVLKSGETIWQDGPITRAVRKNCILYLDEFAEAREDVIVAIHSLTDHRREIYLDKINETIKAQNSFMLVASYNPGYQRGLKEIKPSTKQRFVSLNMSYLDQKRESELINQLTHVDLDICAKLSRIGSEIRHKEGLLLKETVSTRLLVNAAFLIKNGLKPRKACHVAIAESLSDDRDTVISLNDFINLLI